MSVHVQRQTSMSTTCHNFTTMLSSLGSIGMQLQCSLHLHSDGIDKQAEAKYASVNLYKQPHEQSK